mmetsp:Transcript_69340/g.174760  ORF Transcript_69340/g.174760 Transcript_69340/m.174760 type:complete len:241 (-) Transcript_69340:26-748(-)
MADGTISPKMRTTVTETMMANHDGMSLSRNKGKASFADAFASNSVTSKAWPLLGFMHDRLLLTMTLPEIKGSIFSAYRWSCNNLCCASERVFASASEQTSSTSRLQRTFKPNSSNEVRPSVSPAARAAPSTQTKAQMRSCHHSLEPSGSNSVSATLSTVPLQLTCRGVPSSLSADTVQLNITGAASTKSAIEATAALDVMFNGADAVSHKVLAKLTTESLSIVEAKPMMQQPTAGPPREV